MDNAITKRMVKGAIISVSVASVLSGCGGAYNDTGSNSSTSSGSPKLLACSAQSWSAGVNYPLGTVVIYPANGQTYKEVNAGTNGSDGTDPTISTWYWQPTTCSSPTPTPSPSISESSTISTGSNLAVTYSVPSSQLSTKNWIGVYPAGVTPGSGANSSAWVYAPNASGSITVNTSGLAAGSYAVWYLYNDGYSVLSGPKSLSISSNAPTISEPSSINAGSTLMVTYSVPSSQLSAKNWIGVYPSGVTPGSGTNSSAWAYAPNASSSVTINTSGLSGGSYAVWYLYNDGYSVLSGPKSLSITGGSGFVVSETQFNQMFPNRNSFYTYQGLVSAAGAIAGFTTTGSDTVKKQEAAAFLANVAHETGGLVYVEEIDKSGNYCASEPYGCPAGTYQYYGRGPLQLSWNFNYKAAGDWLGIDLLNTPSLLATNATASWKSAIWYWMTQIGPPSVSTMTAHAGMVNGYGFGQTIKSINGDLECVGGTHYAGSQYMQDRVNTYNNFVNILGVPAGSNVTC